MAVGLISRLGNIRATSSRRLVTALVTILLCGALAGADWPTYMGGPLRTGAGADTTLSATTIPHIQKLWAYHTHNIVGATPSIVNDVVYEGSWDGYEYAFDAVTGAVKWQTFLGVTRVKRGCASRQKGVESSAAVVDSVVYVGGGDGYFYALDAATGKTLWRVFLGSTSLASGYYNWSSPLVVNGHAYIGTASRADCPIVTGKLLDIDIATHRVAHTINMVPAHQLGGSIWSSPAGEFGARDGTVYITTGNEGRQPARSQPLTRAVVSISSASATVRQHWQVPDSQAVEDSDFGATPTLFSDSHHRAMIGATNKNGYFYAFYRSRISAGPVWFRRIGDTSKIETSASAFGGGRLFIAGNKATVNGAACTGNVRAVNPGTGALLWQHCTTGPIFGALTYVNGVVIVSAFRTLEMLSAKTGRVLTRIAPASQIYGAAAVSNGRLFFGAVSGWIYAYGLPATTTPTPGPTVTATVPSGG